MVTFWGQVPFGLVWGWDGSLWTGLFGLCGDAEHPSQYDRDSYSPQHSTKRGRHITMHCIRTQKRWFLKNKTSVVTWTESQWLTPKLVQQAVCDDAWQSYSCYHDINIANHVCNCVNVHSCWTTFAVWPSRHHWGNESITRAPICQHLCVITSICFPLGYATLPKINKALPSKDTLKHP